MALRLRGASSGYIELKAPASAGDNTLTLPTNNGGANQLLIIDGSGNLSWQSSLTFDAGLLKIDDLSGTAGKGRLEFGNSGEQFIEGYDTGNAGSGSYLIFGDGSTERFRITSAGQLQATSAADVRLTLGSSGTPGTNDSVHIRADSADLKFMAASGGSTIFEVNGTETLRIKSGGELRIGANSTTASTAGDDLVIEGSSDRGLSIISGTSSSGNIYFGDSGDADIGRIAYQHNDNALDFSVNAGSTALRIDSSGNKIVQNGKLNISSTYIDFSGSLGSAPATAAAIYRPADNNLAFSTANVERFRILNGGNVSITDGDLVIGTAGHGIDFSAQTGTSATGAATTGDETLDHYEEGTWTPVANFGTSGSATVVASGHYTRVGRIVNITWTFYTTAISSPSGDFTLTGLPFSCLDDTNSRFGVSFSFLREFTTDMPNFKGLISGGTTMYFYKHATNAAGSSQVQGSDFTSGSSENYIYGSATYMAA
jgi:hypothetical protein